MAATVCLWLNARVILLMIVTNAGESNIVSDEKTMEVLNRIACWGKCVLSL